VGPGGASILTLGLGGGGWKLGTGLSGMVGRESAIG
jgi:hypothetical protein